MSAKKSAETPLVLVVDDDPDIVEIVSLVLENARYHVISATDGQSAIDLARTGARPCVIVLDLMMPGMDGWAFCDRRRDEPGLAGVPVVVLSGDDVALRQDPPNGVSACLQKPVDLDTLLSTIERCVRSRAS